MNNPTKTTSFKEDVANIKGEAYSRNVSSTVDTTITARNALISTKLTARGRAPVLTNSLKKEKQPIPASSAAILKLTQTLATNSAAWKTVANTQTTSASNNPTASSAVRVSEVVLRTQKPDKDQPKPWICAQIGTFQYRHQTVKDFSSIKTRT